MKKLFVSACTLVLALVCLIYSPALAGHIISVDHDIDILDALVIIDRALGKANCCDYCYFGEIF